MADMQTTVFRNYKTTDGRYIETEQYLEKNQDRFQEIINALPDPDKKLVRKYIEKECYLVSSASDSLYF